MNACVCDNPRYESADPEQILSRFMFERFALIDLAKGDEVNEAQAESEVVWKYDTGSSDTRLSW